MIHDHAVITHKNLDRLEAQLDFVANDDPRLSDARTPTAHSHQIGDLPAVLGKLVNHLVVDNNGDPVLTKGGDVVWAYGA